MDVDTESQGLVLLARHGRTALNAAGLLRGLLDPDLDEVGRAEARELARALMRYGPSCVITSPLRRARQTGQEVADLAGIPIRTDSRLQDRDYGHWAGVSKQDVVARFGSVDSAPEVEPAGQVRHRAMGLLDELDLERPVVVVAHDAVNSIVLEALEPSLSATGPIVQGTACWNVLRRLGPGHWQVEQVNLNAASG